MLLAAKICQWDHWSQDTKIPTARGAIAPQKNGCRTATGAMVKLRGSHGEILSIPFP